MPLHNRNLKKGSHSSGQNESPPQCAQTCSWQEYLLHSDMKYMEAIQILMVLRTIQQFVTMFI